MPATADTIYHLASVTKPYAATVVLQLVEEGKLDLNQPVAEFVVTLDTIGPGARVSHLLSHTSAGTPDTTFRYDGNPYGRLTAIVEKVTGRPFAVELTERIIRRLSLTRTGPNPAASPVVPHLALHLTEPSSSQGSTTKQSKTRWRWGIAGPRWPVRWSRCTIRLYLFASAGLVASAPEVARFSIALDRAYSSRSPLETARGRQGFFRPEPNSRTGSDGSFRRIRGRRFVWHFGQGLESSALLVKIPERELTFVALANSDGSVETCSSATMAIFCGPRLPVCS